MPLTTSLLRELFRNLDSFRILYETEGTDSLPTPEGDSISLWDLEYLYDQLPKLPPRQAQAIQLCLIEGHRETDAAIIMGVSPTNPVCLYGTAGIRKILHWVDEGQLPRCKMEVDLP